MWIDDEVIGKNMKRRFALPRIGLCLAAVVAVASCTDARNTLPTSAPAKAHADLFSPSLMVCPVDTTTTTSAIISPLGGTVSLGGTSILLPAGAVVTNTQIELTIPASQYMEVDITANGGQGFLFSQPVTVTIDYSRCQQGVINLGPRSAWYIDLNTNALLQNMLGVDNPLTDQITFSTLHLSGYAVAN